MYPSKRRISVKKRYIVNIHKSNIKKKIRKKKSLILDQNVIFYSRKIPPIVAVFSHTKQLCTKMKSITLITVNLTKI